MVPLSARSLGSCLALVVLWGCGGHSADEVPGRGDGSESFFTRFADGWVRGSYPEDASAAAQPAQPAEPSLPAGDPAQSSPLARLYDGWVGGSYPDDPSPPTAAQPPVQVEAGLPARPELPAAPLSVDIEPVGEPAAEAPTMDPRWAAFRFYEPDGPTPRGDDWDRDLFHEPIRAPEPVAQRPEAPAAEAPFVAPAAEAPYVAPAAEAPTMDPRWAAFRFYEPDGPTPRGDDWDRDLFHEPIRAPEPTPEPTPEPELAVVALEPEASGDPAQPQDPFGPVVMGEGLVTPGPAEPAPGLEGQGHHEQAPAPGLPQPSPGQDEGLGGFFSDLYDAWIRNPGGTTVDAPPPRSQEPGGAPGDGAVPQERQEPPQQKEQINTTFEGDSVVIEGTVQLDDAYWTPPIQVDLNGIGTNGSNFSNTRLDSRGAFTVLAPVDVGATYLRVLVWEDPEQSEGLAFDWGPITVGDEAIEELVIDFRGVAPVVSSVPSPGVGGGEPGPVLERAVQAGSGP